MKNKLTIAFMCLSTLLLSSCDIVNNSSTEQSSNFSSSSTDVFSATTSTAGLIPSESSSSVEKTSTSMSSSVSKLYDFKRTDTKVNVDITGRTEVFASPVGTSTASGQKNDPLDIVSALDRISTDNVIYLLGGTYDVYSLNSIKLRKNGEANKRLCIYAYNDEEVILDFGRSYNGTPSTGTNLCHNLAYAGIQIIGSSYHIKGITVKGAGSNGIRMSGFNSIAENCITRENGNTGLQIGGSSSETKNMWPKNNLVINCTSFGNFDWDRLTDVGEDADGFACKITTGEGNVFDGCIAYNNSDDGWDLFAKQATGKIGAVTIKNSIAFNNGYGLDGSVLKNGNGFKLGGRAIEVDHYVENCLAFSNKTAGFTDNSNPGTISLINCSAYNNNVSDDNKKNYSMGMYSGSGNYDSSTGMYVYKSVWDENGVTYGPIYNVPKSHNIFRGCLSYADNNAANDAFCGIGEYSYFYSGTANTFGYIANERTVEYNIYYGEVQKLDNPFVEVTSNYLTDLENIDKNMRDNNHKISLGNLFKYNGFNKEITVGCDLS